MTTRQDVQNKRKNNALAKQLFPIAYKQAYNISLQSGVPMADLESEAMFAVAKVIQKGNPERPGFFRYAKLYVQGYLYNYLRDNSRVVRIPRGLSLAYLGEQRQLRINPAYRNMTDEQKADAIGCALDELIESRTAVAIGHSDLDYNDGCTDQAAASSCAEADLVKQIVNAGVAHVATQTRQSQDQVRAAFYASLRKVISQRQD